MKIGFIGAGKMAEAIIASLKENSGRDAHQIFACDVDADRRRLVKRRYAINMYTRSDCVLESTKVVFLAVKPQNFNEVLAELKPNITSRHLVISIAAGRTMASISDILGNGKVVRVMPNLATLVGEGMSVFCANDNVTATEKKRVVNILSCFGRVMELPEEKFHAVTALSGSGPAFFAQLLNDMVEASVKAGLKREDALLLAEQTMLGTSRLLVERDWDPVDLIASVKSPGGTTAAGLEQLQKKEVSAVLAKTINAAAKRSEELSK